MLKGLVLGGITLGVAAVFPQRIVFPFFAVVLGTVSAVYPGMARAAPEQGRPRLEWTATMVFLALAMGGLWYSPIYLVAAWLLHGLWDLLHRVTALGDGIPEGVPGAFFTYDLVMAAFVAYVWNAAV